MHKRDHDQEFAQPRVQARDNSLERETIPSYTYPNKLSKLPDENDENITKVYLKAKNELFHESIVRSPLNAIQAGVFDINYFFREKLKNTKSKTSLLDDSHPHCHLSIEKLEKLDDELLCTYVKPSNS